MRSIVLRELLTSLLIGGVLAGIAFPALLWAWGDPRMARGISLAIFLACSSAGMIAMVFPWLLGRLGVDPAFGSGPVATVAQDIFSIIIYFAVITRML
jgi:magnesium transporter